MWYTKYLTVYEKSLNEIDTQQLDRIIEEVKTKMSRLQSQEPVVTVSVIGYNEERHLLACLWSLADMQCKYPVEVIGVDNESKDRTAEIFERCGIPYYTEPQHSCGFARQCGLNHARGRYHLNIDSDTMYPPLYVEKMVQVLQRPGVVAVSSLWSYIPDAKHSKFGILCYEWSRDLYLWLQHFKRPELSVRGLVFGYHTELGRKVGIRTDIIRGEDGSLALGLKAYGQIAFLHDRKARAITGYGTVGQDGSILNSFKIRVAKGLRNFTSLFYSKTHYEDEDSNLIGKS